MTVQASASAATAPARANGVLTPGFYLLALALTFLSTADLRVRAPGMPSFTLLELVTYPVVLCLACEAALRPRLVDELTRLYRRNRPIVWYAGYAAFASMLGLTRSADTLQVYKDLIPGLLLYAMVFLTVDRHERLVGILQASLSGILLNVALGLTQAATDGPRLVPIARTVEAKLDLAGEVASQVPTGLLAHPNGLAVLLLPAALFLIVGTWPGFRTSRRVSLSSLVMLGATLLVLKLSFARGAAAWLMVGTLFLAVPRRFDRWRFPLAVTTAVIGIGALLWISITHAVEGERGFGTVMGRIVLWLAAIEIIGADEFVALLGSGTELLRERDLDFSNAHSAWLNQALIYGLPALCFYISGLLVALCSLGRTVRFGKHPARTVALAGMASLMVLLGEYFFEPADRSVVLQAQLFLLLALAALDLDDPMTLPLTGSTTSSRRWPPMSWHGAEKSQRALSGCTQGETQ